MNEKKNIDRLFQERFKNFETAAPPESWKVIEARLDQKKKRILVVPLWLKFAGVAAVIAALFSLFLWQNDEFIYDHKMVNGKTENTIDNDNDEEKKPSEVITFPSESVTFDQSGENTVNVSKDELNGIADKTEVTDTQTDGLNTNLVKSKNSHKAGHAMTATTTDGDKLSVPITQIGMDSNPVEANSKKAADVQLDIHEEGIANNTIDTELTYTEELQVQKDSTDLNFIEEETIDNSLEEIATSENETKKEVPLIHSRWNAATIVAPVYAGSISGSSISNRISRDNQNPQVNISYGIAMSYNINARWSIRSGVHQVYMNYSNDNINYGLNSNTLLSSTGSASTIYDPDAVNSNNTTGALSFEDLDTGFQARNILSSFKGQLNQRLGYVEIPVDLRYNLVNGKFNVSLLGGVSALFLTDNEVSITENDRRLDLGEDANFQEFNQSANFGLGFEYRLSRNMGLSLEPTFKYQLNAVRDSGPDFRPYTMGLYTGLLYRF